jgi:hypothetical protein
MLSSKLSTAAAPGPTPQPPGSLLHRDYDLHYVLTMMCILRSFTISWDTIVPRLPMISS